MNEAGLTHETCSELLHPYVKGDLDAPRAGGVERHLKECGDCRAEAEAVRVLLRPKSTLDELERARLHTAVGSALEADRKRGAAPARRGWGARLAPALGAAALIAVIAVAAVSVLNGSGLDESGTSGESLEVQGGTGDMGDEAAREPATTPRVQDDKEHVQKGTATNESALRNVLAPAPDFDADAGATSEGELTEIARKRVLGYADAFRTPNAPRLQERIVHRLATQAPPSVRAQIRDCVAAVQRARGDTVLPTYGGLARIDSRPTLFVAFAWSPAETGALSRYMLWAWPRGSCARTVAYAQGPVDRK